MPGIAYRVQVVGALAYVADALSGLRIIDVSNPAAPVERGHYDTPDSASDVWVVGTLAYVADGNSGLRIIDVSDPAAPAELGFYDTPGSAHSVQVAGTLAYVADSSAGLRIIDVSNPAAPVLRGFCSTPNTARRLQVVGTLAYVADAASGLQIFDVSNPAAPIRRGYYSVMNDALDVQVVATVAYVADWSFGLRTIDVSNPSAPVQTGICDTPGGAEGVDVVGSLAYVADASGGLQVIPITTGPIGTAAQNVTQLDSTTFRVQLGAWLAEGTKYNILVGPEIADLSGNMMDQDANGVAGQMPADGFALTVPGGGQALAMPLAPTLPQGLMTYQGQVASSVDCVGDVDSFVMDLPGGQTAAVLVIPSAGLAPTVQMLGPDRASIGSDSASAAGQQAAIPTVSLAASGRYTVSVAGAATTGTYTIRVILNAAAEGEGYAGTDNGWPFLAQDLNGSFMRLDGGTAGPGLGPQRAAVVGSLAATGDSEDWYSFTLAPGEAATLAATGLAASAAKVELYQWSGVAPTWVTVGTSPVLYPLIADMVLPNGSTVSKIAYRTQADRGKLPLGALAKVVLASGKASYGVVTLVDSVHMFVQLDRSLGVNASMPVQASTTTYSAVLLATGAVGAGLADGGADSVVRDFVSAAGGTYYARVTAKTPAAALDYSLLVTRSATLAAADNHSPASAQDITATGAAFGSTGPAGMGRLFAFDQAANEICELDPQTGAVLHRLAWQAPVQPSGPAGSPALATTATTLLTTVAVPDPAGGEGGYVVYELDPDTGAVLRTVSQGSGSLAAAGAYCDGQVALTGLVSAGHGDLSDVFVEVFNGIPGSGGTFLWSVPMDESYQSPWIVKQSQEQYSRLPGGPGDPGGYVPGADPTTYWFRFEDQGPWGGGDHSFSDMVMKVHHLPDRVVLTPISGNAGYHFRLVRGWGDRKAILIPDVWAYIAAAGPPVEIPAPLGDLEPADLHVSRWGPDPATGQLLTTEFALPGRDELPVGIAGRSADWEVLSRADDRLVLALRDPWRNVGPDQDYDGLVLEFAFSATATMVTYAGGNSGAFQYALLDYTERTVLNGMGLGHAGFGASAQTGVVAAIVLADSQTNSSGSYLAEPYGFHGLAASGDNLWAVEGGVLYRLDTTATTLAPAAVGSLPGIASGGGAGGAGIIGDELFIANGGQIEVYDLGTLAQLRTLAPAGLAGQVLGDLGADEADPGDYYRFTAHAGDNLALWAQATPAGALGLDPPAGPWLADLYDDAGTLLAAGGPDGTIHYVAPADGQYVVRVHAAAGVAGQYVLRVTGASGTRPAFHVASATLQHDATSTNIVVEFSDNFQPGTLAASDILINGTPAAAGSFVVQDGDTASVTWPYADGAWDITVAAGSVLDDAGRGVAAFAGHIALDLTAPSVVGVGLNITSGPQALTVHFSEDVSAALSAGDLILRDVVSGQQIPAGAMAMTYDAATHTGTWTFPGLVDGKLPYGRSYDASLAAATVTDAGGNALAQGGGVAGYYTQRVATLLPGDANADGRTDALDYLAVKIAFGTAGGATRGQGDLTGDAKVDAADLLRLEQDFGSSVPADARPIATPLTPRGPSQPGTSDGWTVGLIDTSSQTDRFTITLTAGQTLAVEATPSGGSTVLDLSVVLRPVAAGSVPLASANQAGPGAAESIPTTPIVTSGTYAIDMTGAADTGFYALHLILTEPQPTATAAPLAEPAPPPAGDPSPDTATFDALAATRPLAGPPAPLAAPAAHPGRAPLAAQITPPRGVAVSRIGVIAILARDSYGPADRPPEPHPCTSNPRRTAEIGPDLLEFPRREKIGQSDLPLRPNRESLAP